MGRRGQRRDWERSPQSHSSRVRLTPSPVRWSDIDEEELGKASGVRMIPGMMLRVR